MHGEHVAPSHLKFLEKRGKITFLVVFCTFTQIELDGFESECIWKSNNHIFRTVDPEGKILGLQNL